MTREHDAAPAKRTGAGVQDTSPASYEAGVSDRDTLAGTIATLHRAAGELRRAGLDDEASTLDHLCAAWSPRLEDTYTRDSCRRAVDAIAAKADDETADAFDHLVATLPAQPAHLRREFVSRVAQLCIGPSHVDRELLAAAAATFRSLGYADDDIVAGIADAVREVAA